MHLADLAALALDLVRQDVGLDACGAGNGRSGFQALLRRGDHVHLVAFEARITRLGRLEGAALQPGARGGRDRYAVAREDRQRVGAGRAVGHRRAAGDDFGRIARHVADQQRHHARRRAVGREAPALDRREVLAHAVHLVDRRAALEQRLVDGLLLLERDAGCGQRQQRRAAARDQAQHEVVGGEPLRELRDALRGTPAGFVGHRVRGFDDFDAARLRLVGGRHMVVARDHQARQRRILGPQRIDGLRHRATRLAGTDHHGAALGRLRQPGRRRLGGQRARPGAVALARNSAAARAAEGDRSLQGRRDGPPHSATAPPVRA